MAATLDPAAGRGLSHLTRHGCALHQRAAGSGVGLALCGGGRLHAAAAHLVSGILDDIISHIYEVGENFTYNIERARSLRACRHKMQTGLHRPPHACGCIAVHLMCICGLPSRVCRPTQAAVRLIWLSSVSPEPGMDRLGARGHELKHLLFTSPGSGCQLSDESNHHLNPTLVYVHNLDLPNAN